MLKVPFELKPYPSPHHSPKPVMSVVFANPSDESKKFPSICLLDSGADFCTLPLSAQLRLGLDLKKMNVAKVPMSCACGNKTFFGYKFKVNVTIYDMEGKPFTNLLWVLFAKSDTMPLIGRNLMDIFENMSYNNTERKDYFLGLREEEL